MKRELLDLTGVLGIAALLLAVAIFWGEVLDPVIQEFLKGGKG